MKKSTALFAVMAALSVGTASAAGTIAGTTIQNTASASFQDPANTANTISSTSNTVNTVVLPKPGFDIVFTGGTADGGTQNDITTTTVQVTGAVPGQRVVTSYSVVNNGNVALTVALTADATGANAGQTVQYFLDANGDGVADNATPLTSVTLNPDDPATTGTDEGIVKIVQVVTLPTDPAQINVNSIFGASPEGVVTGTQGADPLVTPGNGYANGSANYEDGKAVDTDRQFVRIRVFAPNLDNLPNSGPSNPVDSAGTPITDPTKVPPITNVDVPTETTGKTGDNTPVVTTPGYRNPTTPAGDPTIGGTPITPNVAGDAQIAYPTADTNNTPDVVTFTNNLVNRSGATDTVQLFPALANGTVDPAYTFNAATGVFTNTTTGVSIRFLDPITGAPIAVSTDPNNPTVAQYPTVSIPTGKTAVYRTEVTFPDPDDSNPVAAVTVLVGADSLKDADLTSNSTTTDIILPPAMQFGDATAALGTVPTPTPVQTVNPNGATGGVSSPDGGGAAGDRTAVFSMDVVNNGQYNDSYTLVGSVTLTDATTSATTVVPVRYYAPDGTILPRVSNDPNSADYNKFITPVLAPGTEYKPYAVIQTLANTATGDYLVSQTATANYSTIVLTDNNDIVRVSANGSVNVAKFVAKAGVAAATNPANGIDNPAGYTATGANGAQPGANISYRIIGKNTYNSAVTGFFLRDTVPANTTFASVALNPVPTRTIYRVNGGAWSVTAPAAGLAAGTVIDVALDADANNQPDSLAAGASLSADFVVTVK
ncbi:hypothetical protein K7W42_07850 [Deinococcus sp. HMF7604]|uniref:beta strand repeat-containing protein n=1 Tax=Deinococcus betulae TaxID=2873312 RepID=UPI001CCE5CAB|nr:hypothetical protein [Deinococcus betulae]MBZ9750773.1 hypothetical protein [Deinococcus betulae]